MVQRAGRRLFVDGRQDIIYNGSGRVTMQYFLADILTPALFSTRMGDTGARIDIAWDSPTDRERSLSGIMTLLIGCNRPGCLCDLYRMSFTCDSSF